MSETQSLSPAQFDFLRENLPGFSLDNWRITEAGRAGSQRSFFRVQSTGDDGESYVLVIWDGSDPDWSRFVGIHKDLGEHGSVLPTIYAADPDRGLILEEDLGNRTLKQACIEKNAGSGQAMEYYRQVLRALLAWQRIDVLGSTHISGRSMDYGTFMWESEYFSVHCVREYFGIDSLPTDDWHRERVQMAQVASSAQPVAIHRDFQSENILIKNGEIRFVDYQGARLGPAAYDLASLLYDPYIKTLSADNRRELRDYFLARGGNDGGYDVYRTVALQRSMQALGAYANLMLHKGKPWYENYIPTGIRRLHEILDGGSDFPRLRAIVDECASRIKGRMP